MRFLIFGPLLVFLLSCFVSIAVALGVNMAVVTSVLMVTAGVFTGCLIFLMSFGGQWRPTGTETQTNKDMLPAGDAGGTTAPDQKCAPTTVSEKSSSVESQVAQMSSGDEQSVKSDKVQALAMPGQVRSPG